MKIVDNKALVRDLGTVTKGIDEALYAFAERVQKEQPSMEQLDLFVDDARRDMLTPIAQYVKRTLRRHGLAASDQPEDKDG
jgi:hypothetical protein